MSDKLKPKVIIYSDGSARKNPYGCGGYGVIVEKYDENGELLSYEEFMEAFSIATNNTMELMGAITGFENIREPSDITLYTDSQYITKAFNDDWIKSWKKNKWKTSAKKDVKNISLWKRLLKAMKGHDITIIWVKGHSGNLYNERADTLAQAAADGIKSLKKDGVYEF